MNFDIIFTHKKQKQYTHFSFIFSKTMWILFCAALGNSVSLNQNCHCEERIIAFMCGWAHSLPQLKREHTHYKPWLPQSQRQYLDLFFYISFTAVTRHMLTHGCWEKEEKVSVSKNVWGSKETEWKRRGRWFGDRARSTGCGCWCPYGLRATQAYVPHQPAHSSICQALQRLETMLAGSMVTHRPGHGTSCPLMIRGRVQWPHRASSKHVVMLCKALLDAERRGHRSCVARLHP